MRDRKLRGFVVFVLAGLVFVHPVENNSKWLAMEEENYCNKGRFPCVQVYQQNEYYIRRKKAAGHLWFGPSIYCECLSLNKFSAQPCHVTLSIIINGRGSK